MFLPGEFHGQRSPAGSSPQCLKSVSLRSVSLAARELLCYVQNPDRTRLSNQTTTTTTVERGWLFWKSAFIWNCQFWYVHLRSHLLIFVQIQWRKLVTLMEYQIKQTLISLSCKSLQGRVVGHLHEVFKDWLCFSSHLCHPWDVSSPSCSNPGYSHHIHVLGSKME